MAMNYSISIVLPAFNEEKNIAPMVSHAISALDSLKLNETEIIIVNDGSKDKTGEIADALKRKYPNILRIIHHEVNKGYASALKTGFANAKYPLVFFTDSDRQFDLNEMKYLLQKIDNYDIVCGFRAKRIDPIHRIIIAGIYNRIIHILFDLNIKDIDCAFKLFRKNVLDSITIESKGFLVNLEIVSKARKKGFRITEVPVTHYKRPAGKSTVTSCAIFNTMCGIIRLKKQLG